MTYPYDPNNWNNNLYPHTPRDSQESKPENAQDSGWTTSLQPVQTTYWDGSSYHSGAQPSPVTPPPEKKPRRARKLALKITAAVAACVVVAAVSVGTYSALLGSGVISPPTASQGSTGGTGSSGNSSDGTIKTVTASGNTLTPEEVAEKVIPSVVCIQNYQQYQGGFGQQSGLQEAGEGSGIIATADGYIITNAHVVSGAASLQVVLSDGTKYEAELIGSDTVTDLALIKINASGLTPAEFGNSDDLKVAEMVMAVGNPGGMAFQSSVTIGYVSGLNRLVTELSGAAINCIQTDAAINPGNSGGALVNMYGQVIGINTSKIAQTDYEGLGFAIPISSAQPIINSLRENGYVKDRAVLGISGQYLDAMAARYYGLSQGMYISEISNSSLTEAGVQTGDVIIAVDGITVESSDTITNIVTQKKPGDTVTLQIVRKSRTFSVTVTLMQSTGK